MIDLPQTDVAGLRESVGKPKNATAIDLTQEGLRGRVKEPGNSTYLPFTPTVRIEYGSVDLLYNYLAYMQHQSITAIF